MKITIDEKEYTVKFNHFNNSYEKDENGKGTGRLIKDNVGHDNTLIASYTECHIFLPSGTVNIGGVETPFEPVISAHALCHSKDNFNRKVGRKVSFRRAVRQIADRSLRRKLWEAFLEGGVKNKTIYVVRSNAQIYIYKDKPYRIVSFSKIKLNGIWEDTVNYTCLYPNPDGTHWTRFRKDFFNLFKPIEHDKS